MPDWVVNIVKGKSGQAEFVVDFPGAQQGQPLQAQQDDLVSWYNQTRDTHQPWQTDSNYNRLRQSDLSDPIPPGQSSNNYDCAQPAVGSPPEQPQTWQVYYACALHPNNPNERGLINVTALPTNSVNILDSGSAVTFAPQARGARKNDLINWNNLTQEEHQPWPTDASYNPLSVQKGDAAYLSDPIQPGESSGLYTVAPPAGNPKSWTVYYCCYLHQEAKSERGTIVVPPPRS
jgi:hypothetical protein